MFTTGSLNDRQDANDFAEHPAVRPELAGFLNGSPDGRPRGNRIDAAEYYLADVMSHTIAIGDDVNVDVGIDLPDDGGCWAYLVSDAVSKPLVSRLAVSATEEDCLTAW